MKKNTIKILIVLVVVAAKTNCFAQSNEYFAENTKRIEAYLNRPAKANICEGVINFPSKYKPSKVKSDAFITSFVNSIDNKFTDNDSDMQLKKIGKKILVKESLNGLIKIKNILLKGNYLRANIVIEFIDNVTVRSKVTLTTVTHAKCGEYGNLMMDFKLVSDFFLQDAKMLFGVKYDEMVADTIYSDNLALLAVNRKDYKFNIPGTDSESWVNDVFIKQYQADSSGSYNYSKAPKDFVKLIKENKISVVKDLLFSPNYFVSVNAMEALLYLSSVNKVQLTKDLNDRIAEIKKQPFIILQQGAPDVFYNREGYKDLQMTDERVIKKYSSSM